MIHKRPGYDPFFAKNPFSPADEFVFTGLVVRSCHFDVTACAEARRLEKAYFQCAGVVYSLTFGHLSPLMARVVYAIFFWLVALTEGTVVTLSLARIYLILKV